MEVPFGNTSVLITGDSFPLRAIDPTLFNNSKNISQSGEPLFISYWKLKYLFNEIEVDTLLLSYSHHIISAFNDKKLTNNKWSFEMFRRTYSLVDYPSKDDIKYSKKDFYNVYFRNMFLYPKLNHLNIIGEFKPVQQNNISHIDVTIKRHFYEGEDLIGISELSVSYLDSIVSLCKEKNVFPVFVSSPVTQKYYDLIPAPTQQKFDVLKQKYSKQGVLFIDKSIAPYPLEYFMNGDHLNQKGATKFTLQIIENLKKPPR